MKPEVLDEGSLASQQITLSCDLATFPQMNKAWPCQNLTVVSLMHASIQ